MMAKDWKRAMRRLGPGVYSDGEGTMHLDIEELLIANGYPPTPENIEMMTGVVMAQMGSDGVPITVEEHRDGGGAS